MRILIVVLILFFFALQYRLWVGEGSYADIKNLELQIQQQHEELKQMKQRNQELRAEVDDLKNGLQAIEERARSELGMIKEGEVFFQIVEPGQGSGQ